MKNLEKVMQASKRSQYFGNSKLTLLMKLSHQFEQLIKHWLVILPTWRKNKIGRTLQYMFGVGDRVVTPHGNGIVVKTGKAIQSDGLGGFIEVDVKYDSNAPNPNKLEVGHYNQIFLERES